MQNIAQVNKTPLSVVIAVKNPTPNHFYLCLASFAALENSNKLQIILVCSGDIPPLNEILINSFGDIVTVDVPAKGVYSAYNSGICYADGQYLLFFGADDIVLPALDKLIDEVLLVDNSYTMVAAAAYMQSTGLSRPTSLREGLIFANWCHQSLFYNFNYIKYHKYDLSYPVQADHKMNIDIVSDKNNKIYISGLVVSYFSAGGISTSMPDLRFREDYAAIISAAYGAHWGLFIRFKQLVIDFFKGPPEKAFKINGRR